MAQNDSFRYEIEKSEDPVSGPLTTITCHGRLVAGHSGEISELVKPLLSLGGRIVIDLGDLNYLDSSGLGALVGLKVSAIKQGLATVEFVKMTPRVLELLHITNLMQLFSS
jgi:anti-sigma B factor antagonist